MKSAIRIKKYSKATHITHVYVYTYTCIHTHTYIHTYTVCVVTCNIFLMVRMTSYYLCYRTGFVRESHRLGLFSKWFMEEEFSAAGNDRCGTEQEKKAKPGSICNLWLILWIYFSLFVLFYMPCIYFSKYIWGKLLNHNIEQIFSFTFLQQNSLIHFCTIMALHVIVSHIMKSLGKILWISEEELEHILSIVLYFIIQDMHS